MFIHSRIVNVAGETIDLQPGKPIDFGQVWGFGPILIGFSMDVVKGENGQPVKTEMGYYHAKIEVMLSEHENVPGTPSRLIVPDFKPPKL